MLHFSLFQDAFASATTKRYVGHNAIFSSLAEFGTVEKYVSHSENNIKYQNS
jgi:hypothetical protein